MGNKSTAALVLGTGYLGGAYVGVQLAKKRIASNGITPENDELGRGELTLFAFGGAGFFAGGALAGYVLKETGMI